MEFTAQLNEQPAEVMELEVVSVVDASPGIRYKKLVTDNSPAGGGRQLPMMVGESKTEFFQNYPSTDIEDWMKLTSVFCIAIDKSEIPPNSQDLNEGYRAYIVRKPAGAHYYYMGQTEEVKAGIFKDELSPYYFIGQKIQCVRVMDPETQSIPGGMITPVQELLQNWNCGLVDLPPNEDFGALFFDFIDLNVAGVKPKSGGGGGDGEQGYQGDQGDQGYQGPQGDPDGPQGDQGDQGDQGVQGMQGASPEPVCWMCDTDCGTSSDSAGSSAETAVFTYDTSSSTCSTGTLNVTFDPSSIPDWITIYYSDTDYITTLAGAACREVGSVLQPVTNCMAAGDILTNETRGDSAATDSWAPSLAGAGAGSYSHTIGGSKRYIGVIVNWNGTTDVGTAWSSTASFQVTPPSSPTPFIFGLRSAALTYCSNLGWPSVTAAANAEACFEGPQGFQGYKGEQGYQGYQGEQGFQGYGSQGFQGYKGYQGFQGYQGEFGEQGYQGYSGVDGSGHQGYQGYGGVQGYQGAYGSGEQGYQGYSGVDGSGHQGYQGESGTRGYQGAAGSGSSQVEGDLLQLLFVGTNDGGVTKVASGTSHFYLDGVNNENAPDLYIQGGASAADGVAIHVTDTGLGSNPRVDVDLVAGSGVGYVGTSTNTPFMVRENLGAAGQFMLLSGGNAGFGINIPDAKVDIWGDLRIATIPQVYSGSFLVETGDGRVRQWDVDLIGYQGFQGEQGYQGYRGEGFQGYSGLSGASGEFGYQGYRGISGISGAGSQGDQGTSGISGSAGGVGWQGDQGAQGDQGMEGFSMDGAQGDQGMEGMGGYGMQGDQGAGGPVPPSDVSLKENIKPLTGSLAKLNQLRPVEFDWNDKAKATLNLDGHEVGLIAQEVELVLPEVVGKYVKGEEFKTVDYAKLTPLLIDCVQDLAGPHGDKFAIVKGVNEGEWVGLTCVEMPETRFEDVIILKPEGAHYFSHKLDEQYCYVCETDSISAVGFTCSSPAECGIRIENNHLILNFKDLVPETVTVKISCIRKGHVKRFKPFTEEESIRNAQFWDSWKNKKP